MECSMREVREEFRREPDFSTKNAIARHVRRRWPANTVKEVMSEWDLTDGEARGAVYAQASQATIDKILKHDNGGWRLAIEVMGAVIGSSLDAFLEQERGRLAREKQQYEARDRRLGEMVFYLRSADDLGSDGPS